MLKKSGVYTHLISDHYHYWEEGGHNYNTRYNSWEFVRGQEGDPWIGQVAEPEFFQREHTEVERIPIERLADLLVSGEIDHALVVATLWRFLHVYG